MMFPIVAGMRFLVMKVPGKRTREEGKRKVMAAGQEGEQAVRVAMPCTHVGCASAAPVQHDGRGGASDTQTLADY